MMEKTLGVNYIDPKTTHWPPHPWLEFDAKRISDDFARISKLGFHVVRIFLTAKYFLPTPNEVSERAIETLDTLLPIAKSSNIRIQLTGPDHWEGWPAWVPSDRYTNPKMKHALVVLWETLARKYKGEQAIYAWELLNEPDIEFTPPKDYSIDSIYECQLERERTATEWVRFQSNTIKKYDRDHPITLGFVQFIYPLQRAHHGSPAGYNPFQPINLAPYLDLVSLHFYPIKIEVPDAGNFTTFSGDNLEYLLAYVAFAAICGKPLQIGEFGLWGGGQPDGKPYFSEDLQNSWGRQLLSQTSPFVDGWLNWTFEDIPVAKDISRYTGLLDSEGKLKKWGKTFSGFALGKKIPSVKRSIVPLKLPKKDVLSKLSVRHELKNIIMSQKAKNVIYQLTLE